MPNRYDSRKVGEALWPENPSFTIPMLQKIKHSVGADWDALYQGRPQPLTGDLFNASEFCYWYPYKTNNIPRPVQVDKTTQPQPQFELPHTSMYGGLTLSGDLSFKGKQDSDYIALGIWMTHGGKEYLLDQVVGQKGFSDTLNAIVVLLKKWPMVNNILIEDTANGPAIIETLKAELSGVTPVNPRGGKIVRAHAITPKFASGDIVFPHPTVAPWVGNLVRELVKFPRGKNDDQVDQLTQYLNWRTIRKKGLDRLLALSVY